MQSLSFAIAARNPQFRSEMDLSHHFPISGTPLDNDDLLTQVLLFLPSPSSLGHASLVCKRWHQLISDPSFHRRFFACHQKPPLLGVFSTDSICSGNIYFTPTPDSPDNTTAPTRLVVCLGSGSEILGCRHGRVLASNWARHHFCAWDPITGDQRNVTFPQVFDGRRKVVINGALICVAREQSHVHGSCNSGPFKVVLLGRTARRIFACVYSSETSAWGNCTSILRGHFRAVSANHSSTLVGNSICWLLTGQNLAILEFDMDLQRLDVIEVPSDALDRDNFIQVSITQADGGELGFLVLSYSIVQLWRRKHNCDGVAEWVLRNTIELSSTLSVRPQSLVENPPLILGFAEEDNVLFLFIDFDIFMVHMGSLKFKKLAPGMGYRLCHPFTNFYIPGKYSHPYILYVLLNSLII